MERSGGLLVAAVGVTWVDIMKGGILQAEAAKLHSEHSLGRTFVVTANGMSTHIKPLLTSVYRVVANVKAIPCPHRSYTS